MGTITYRIMQTGDFATVLALWQETENIGLSSADTPTSLAHFLTRNPGLSFVALDDLNLAGAVLSGHDGRRGAIYHLAVAQSYRRQGIGQQLVYSCLSALKKAGIERCHIHVYAQNQPGLTFWQKSGWFLRPELALLSIDIK